MHLCMVRYVFVFGMYVRNNTSFSLLSSLHKPRSTPTPGSILPYLLVLFRVKQPTSLLAAITVYIHMSRRVDIHRPESPDERNNLTTNRRGRGLFQVPHNPFRSPAHLCLSGTITAAVVYGSQGSINTSNLPLCSDKTCCQHHLNVPVCRTYTTRSCPPRHQSNPNISQRFSIRAT